MTALSCSFEYLKKMIDSRIHDNETQKPLIVGISGVQGSGKSFLSSQLVTELSGIYPDLNIITFSMDDIYLTHEEQKNLEKGNPGNPLIQGRGLPGTHDIQLGIQLFKDLIAAKEGKIHSTIKLPVYDKSKFAGEGDRLDTNDWIKIEKPVDVIIFEGWFNGFKPVSHDEISQLYDSSSDTSHIRKYPLQILQFFNKNLEEYTQIWNLFDCFIYLAVDALSYVYDFRIEQEHYLIKLKGAGMNDADVRKFVDRYMPIYELYYNQLITTGFCDSKGGNLRLLIGKNRHLISSNIF